MKTKKMITMGVLVMAFWLGMIFQPQPASAANGETGAETEAGMPDMESRVSDDPQESSRAGENTGQKAGSGGVVPDGSGGQEGNYPDAQGAMVSADGDNAVVVDSASTAYSEETSSIIAVTAAVPEHFGLAAYAEIISVEFGVTYGLPLYASNGYYQRCYVPAGTYYVGNVAVYGDTTNEYPFDFPAEPRRITYGCPLSEEAEAVLLVRGRMGDREAKQVFFAAYEGLVKKRAASFYHHGNGRRLLGDFDEAVSLACEAFYQAMDEADVVKDGRLVRVSNLFGVIARRYEARERMDNLSVSIPANLYHAANRLDAYLKDNMLCLEDISRETCEDAGCCGSFGWMSVRDACAALRMGSQTFSDLQYADVTAELAGGRKMGDLKSQAG